MSVTFEVYDVRGKQLFTQKTEVLEAGAHRILGEYTKRLEGGIYFIVLESDSGKRIAKKISLYK